MKIKERKERKKEGRKRKMERKEKKEEGKGEDRPWAGGGRRRRPEVGGQSPKPKPKRGASVVKNEKLDF